MRGKRALVAMQPVVHVAGRSRKGGGKTEHRGLGQPPVRCPSTSIPSPRSPRLVVDLRIELPIAGA